MFTDQKILENVCIIYVKITKLRIIFCSMAKIGSYFIEIIQKNLFPDPKKTRKVV